MIYTQWAPVTADRDWVVNLESWCFAEFPGSGPAPSLLLASGTGKLIAVVILLFVPVYIPGIRYLNDIK